MKTGGIAYNKEEEKEKNAFPRHKVYNLLCFVDIRFFGKELRAPNTRRNVRPEICNNKKMSNRKQ
jgi:hypothetical protein